MINEELYTRVKNLMLPAVEELSKMEEMEDMVIVIKTKAGWISFGSIPKPREWLRFIMNFVDQLIFNVKEGEQTRVGETPKSKN